MVTLSGTLAKLDIKKNECYAHTKNLVEGVDIEDGCIDDNRIPRNIGLAKSCARSSSRSSGSASRRSRVRRAIDVQGESRGQRSAVRPVP